MKDAARKLLGAIILAGIALGVFGLLTAPYEMYRKAQAEAWPSRMGVITLSHASEKPGSPRRYWKPEICGNYLDSGERFCIERVRLGEFRLGDGESEAREAVERYPIGRQVQVHYDPQSPGETMLEAKSSWKEMLILMGLSVFFLGLPFVLLLGKKLLK